MLNFLVGNPWKYINENDKWAAGATFQGITRSLYQLMFSIGIGLIAISIVILFIRWALYRQQGGAVNRRNTLVGPLMFKLIIVSIISCLPYLIGELYRIINLIARSLVAVS